MTKELIVQLAKEHGADIGTWDKSGNGGLLISFTFEQLEAFAKAYAQTQGKSEFNLDADTLEACITWLEQQEQTVNVGNAIEPDSEVIMESTAGFITRYFKSINNTESKGI